MSHRMASSSPSNPERNRLAKKSRNVESPPPAAAPSAPVEAPAPEAARAASPPARCPPFLPFAPATVKRARHEGGACTFLSFPTQEGGPRQ